MTARALLLVAATVAMVALVAPAPAARASSAVNRIDFTPTSGPVGAQITVTVTLYTVPPNDQPMQLTAAPWGQPDACTHSATIPNAGVFAVGTPQVVPFVMSQPIQWPADFGPGQYVICALSTADQSVVAEAPYPFTVTDGQAAPSPTLASQPPVATIKNTTYTLPDDNQVTVEIDHWAGQVPAQIVGQVTLLEVSTKATVLINAFGYAASPDAPDTTMLNFTLPPNLSSGSYEVELSGGNLGDLTTQSFTVVNPAVPAANAAATRVPVAAVADATATPIMLVVAALLALAVVVLAAPAVARRRPR